MGDRVQQAADQIDMKPGEQVSITFAADRRHDGHADGYVVEKREDGGYDVEKDHQG